MFFVLCWGPFAVCIFGKENFPAVNCCLYDVYCYEFFGYCTGARNCKLYYLLKQFRELNEERHLLMVQLRCSASELTGKNKSLKIEIAMYT